eukprot:CAMPEP_0174282822 /NCGR_PEP_ID=MMETSP0809-20121228/3400_1 /TAXON_ID=73025 ORGANISM="Eutreptiella gymnastica-like, Strain CCMP1594" /NCGR_SAMPLE_ID=MMETSP0809 /ASSEMBLY_ACC=CAM_ASM_000658 /LENGTH=101 /DNA_ID=CAMNT_0015377301 /DNA_START=523 /DNA_END=828 /DNA_ORIENTATION=+
MCESSSWVRGMEVLRCLYALLCQADGEGLEAALHRPNLYRKRGHWHCCPHPLPESHKPRSGDQWPRRVTALAVQGSARIGVVFWHPVPGANDEKGSSGHPW